MTNSDTCYLPLGRNSRSIRLLVLLPPPHPEDNRIQCKLVIASLNDLPSYEALSYTWGDPDVFNFLIWVDGVLVRVRQNLLCALRALRTTTERILWIDALCINQNDTLERRHQVEMMGDIYRNAGSVLSWLGTPDPWEMDSSLDITTYSPRVVPVPAFDIVKWAARTAIEALWSSSTPVGLATASQCDGEGHEQPERKWLRDFSDYHTTVNAWKQLHQLFRLEYWSRLWIIQEVCLARRLYLLYGTQKLDWKDFRILRRTILHLSDDAAGPSKVKPETFMYIQESQPWKLEGIISSTHREKKTDLRSLIELSETCVCQEKRDKIFGILGLASDIGHEDILVDYSQSLFQLYGNVLSAYRHQGSGRDRDIVAFSRVLQRTLVNPNFDFLTMLSMDYDHDHDLCDPRPHKISGRIMGRVSTVSTNPDDVLPDAEGKSNVGTEGSNLALIHPSQSQPGVEELWQRALEEAWKQERSFVSFDDVDDRARLGTVLGKTGILLGKTNRLKMFKTSSRQVGIAPGVIEVGDLLWQCGSLETEVFHAIVRNVNDEFIIIGRARLGLAYNKTIRRSKNFKDFDSSEQPPDKELVKIEIQTPALQALTCPFRYSSKVFPQAGSSRYG